MVDRLSPILAEGRGEMRGQRQERYMTVGGGN